jgi:hypothetical protein
MSSGVGISFAERIRVRDGTVLAAHLYRPHGSSPLPVVLSFTPYGADYQMETGLRIAARGYAYLVVECRGRGDSEGHFAVYEDTPDVVDAIAWAATQPWSDGRVVLQGGSYAGLLQWPVAAARPPALIGITPLVAPMPGHDSDYWGGVFPYYTVQWARLVSGRSPKWRIFGNPQVFRDELVRHARSGAPASEMMHATCPGDTTLARILAQVQPGPEWDFARPDAAGFAHIDVPALSITGAADSALRGAIRYFEQHDRHAVTRSLRRLVIGPWTHAGARLPERLEGDGEGPDPLADPAFADELEISWFDYLVGRGPLPELLRQQVSVFVAGEEAWRTAPSLVALVDQVLAFSLDPAEQPCDEQGPGRLGAAGEAGAPAASATFIYDPSDLRYGALEASGAVGDLFMIMSGEFPWEVGPSDNLFGQGLRFDSRPFADPVVLMGAPELLLHLRLDVPDTDLMYLLQALLPDGRALLLSADMLRLRYRGWDGSERLMTPGESELLRFEGARFVARRLPAGTALRLTIRAPASIYLERHGNRGSPVCEQGAEGAATARIEVLCGGAEGSWLRIPTARLR